VNTIDKLKAAYEAATPGEWIKGSPQEPNMAYVGTGDGGWLGLAALYGDTEDEAHANAEFITLAYNHMPDLLEAVEILEALCEWIDDDLVDAGVVDADAVESMRALIEKLKGH
jgi:hypothetical protein